MNNSNDKKYIGAFVNFALDSSDMSSEDIATELKNDGFNVDLFLKKIEIQVNQELYGKSWKDTAKQNKDYMESVYDSAMNKFTKIFNESKESTIAKINDILASGKFQVQHRDFSDMSEDDIKTLLEDVEFLRALDDSKTQS